MRQRGQDGPVETKTRVVVAMTGAPGGDVLIRRGARMSDRLHGELIGVHVHPPGATPEIDPNLEANRRLLTSLGGHLVQVAGEDVAAALVAFVRAENATQLVIGGSKQSRFDRVVHGSVVGRVLDISEGIDVHVIAALPQPESISSGRRAAPRWSPAPTGRRLSWLLAMLVAPTAVAVVRSTGGVVALPVEMLFLIVLVATIAWTGGKVPAIVGAVLGLGTRRSSQPPTAPARSAGPAGSSSSACPRSSPPAPSCS